MSAGFYLTSGILYLNMTPEILFVLLNRMKAQKIDIEKGMRSLLFSWCKNHQ